MKNKMPNSLRKYFRKEKARIRREVFNTQDQQEAIKELYKKYYPKQNNHPENIQPNGN